ncbi:MAG: O-antigen ligase family protein [Armatimonadota bacterium]
MSDLPTASAAAHPAEGYRRTHESAATGWREPLAGALIVLGLCGPFLFSSVLPVRSYMFLPFAFIGGMMRQRWDTRSWKAQIPFFLLCAIMAFYTLYAVTQAPLSAYGQTKVQHFFLLAGFAYVAACRQAPLTDRLARGIRWSLFVMLLIGLIITFINRELYLDVERYGVAELTQTFSITGFPLAIAMAACSLFPANMSPRNLLISGVALLFAAVAIVFVRGRMHALLLMLLLGAMVLGPALRLYFWHVLVSVALIGVGVAIYLHIVPQLGGSYQYFTWLSLESVGGRLQLFTSAAQGFFAHPFGQGIGSFEGVEVLYNYPHNIILEAAYEMGIFGLGAMLAIYALVIRRAWQLWHSPSHRFLAGLLVMVFGYNLKAGDLAAIPFQWVLLYLLVVCTPVAASWPLLRRRTEP